jgi:hypothetical protein
MSAVRKEIVESYLVSLNRSYEFISTLLQSTKTRLVWFVGLAGFGLINAQSYWENLAGIKLSDFRVFWFSLPLISSMVFGIITHFLTDELAIKDFAHLNSKISMLDLHLIKIEQGNEDANEFSLLILDKHPDLKNVRDQVSKYSLWTRWLERITFFLFLFGFVWIVIGPIVI